MNNKLIILLGSILILGVIGLLFKFGYDRITALEPPSDQLFYGIKVDEHDNIEVYDLFVNLQLYSDYKFNHLEFKAILQNLSYVSFEAAEGFTVTKEDANNLTFEVVV